MEKKKVKEDENSESVVVDNLSPDRGDEMQIDREEVTPERKKRQEEIARSVETETMGTNKSVETKESTSSATRSYAAVVQSGPAVPAKVKKVKPSPLGIPYPKEEQQLSLVCLVRNSQRIPFVDSHFHLDRVQQQSTMGDLEQILANPTDPNEIRSCNSQLYRRRTIKECEAGIFTFGVHLKRAHKVTPEEMKVVKEVVLKEPKCVVIGEMGYNLTDGCSVHLDKQMKVFKEQLRHYSSKELWSTVMVIHCQDIVDSMTATELCLDTMGSQLFSKLRGSYRIHVHCFNGEMTEKDSIPNSRVWFHWTVANQ